MPQEADAERLDPALSGAGLALWALDVRAGVVSVDACWYAMLGLSPGPRQCALQVWVDRLHPDDRARVLATRGRHLDGHSAAYEAMYRLRHERGDWIWLLDRGQVRARDAQGRAAQMSGVQIDISSSMGAHEALLADHRRMRATLHALRSGVIIHGPDARIIDCNRAACGLLKMTPEQLRGVGSAAPAWQFLEADGSVMAPERYPVSRVLSSGMPISDELGGIVHPGQAPVTWVLVNAERVDDADGQLQEVVVTLSDITELLTSRDRLVAVQDRLTATLAAVPDLMFEITRSGVIVDLHSPRPEVLLKPADEQIGRTVQAVMPVPAARVLMQAISDALARGFSGGLQYALSLPGGQRWFELSVAPKRVADGQEPRCIVLTRDITDRRRAERGRRVLEARLRDTQKLEAVGTLASGIAHDFNNLVAGVLGHAALAQRALPAGHAAAEPVRQIEAAGLRARALVEQILAFSRREPARMDVLALDSAVRETVSLLRATAPAGVRLVERHPARPVHVHGDATQLQQVVMNLCLNAWQALPDAGGEVEVEVRVDGQEALLTVRDDGVGMSAQTRRRIFEPFFSTKARGRGTGLGLAVVHGIVLAHQGRIEVDSLPGVGTQFSVWLPLTDAPLSADAPSPPVAAEAAGQGQHLLYVDDDEILRHLVPRLLAQAGWRVTTCADATSALAWMHTPDGEPALLLSDMNMPDLSGLELARRVQAAWPALPVVLISGHASAELHEQARNLGVAAVVAKERLLDELAPAVAAALASAGGGTGWVEGGS